MTIEKLYGSRPDHLPRSMVHLVRSNEDPRRPIWTGRPGVELLSLADHDLYEQSSVDRFPRRSDGTIDWHLVAIESILGSSDADSTRISALIDRFTPDAGQLVFFWSSLTMPTTRMAPDVAKRYSDDIAAKMPEFWMYSTADNVLVEQAFNGKITVATVPVDSTATDSSGPGHHP